MILFFHHILYGNFLSVAILGASLQASTTAMLDLLLPNGKRTMKLKLKLFVNVVRDIWATYIIMKEMLEVRDIVSIVLV